MRLTRRLTQPIARKGSDRLPIVAGGGGPFSYQAESTTLFAAMTVQPSTARKGIIDNLIIQLKGAGLWTTLDLLYIVAAHDAQAGRINWKNPAQVCAVNGTPTFTTDRGYAGDGAAAYLGTGVNQGALTQYQQDNACAGIWCQNDTTNANPIIGTTSTNHLSIVPRNASNNMTMRLNTGTVGSTAMAAANGHALSTRSASTAFDMYKNATFQFNAVIASGARAPEEVVLLRNTTSYSAGHILSAAHIGAALNASQISNLYNALQTYMTAVGA